jgi:hypothetical protein
LRLGTQAGERARLPREHLARRPLGVERVRLEAPAAALTPRPLDLEHLLAAAGQEAGQPGAVGASALERPGAGTGRLPAREP